MSAPTRLAAPPRRDVGIDQLRVALVTIVIIGHAILIWAEPGAWTVSEPPITEPIRSLGLLAVALGSLFAMGLFFFISGLFTAGALERHGSRGYLGGRLLRLGVPLVCYWLLISPVVEYPDQRNAAFTGDLQRFVVHVWWPPQLGSTWFLAALLALTLGYVGLRRLAPGSVRLGTALVGAAVVIAVGSYLVRLAVPLGAELYGFELAHAPSWVIMFGLGTMVARAGGLAAIPPGLVRGWSIAAAVAVVGVAVALARAGSLAGYAGGASWESLLAAAAEGCVAVGAAVGLTALARRRSIRPGPVLVRISGAAFAAFLLHQPILVWTVVVLRRTALPTEARFAVATILAVGGAFLLGDALTRLRRFRVVLDPSDAHRP